VTGHIGADPWGVVSTARVERALMIVHARFGLFGLGVSEQHQAHGNSIDFPGT
jgi:hypothetical protein